jgi:hypothetical protein
MLHRFLGDEGVNTKHLSIVAVILVMAIILGTFSTYIWMENLTIGDLDDITEPLIECKLSNLREEDTTVYIMNVTQGSTQQVDFTLTSKTDQELTIPLDLELMVLHSETYNGELDCFFPSPDTANCYYYNQSAQNKLFNYTFSPSQLGLQPHQSNSTIITLEIVKDAPLGFYAFNIMLGNFGGVTHRWQLDVVVDPKLE